MAPNDSHDHAGATGAETTGVRSLNALLEVLTHHHRRETLRVLRDDPDHTTTVEDLTSHLIDREAHWTGRRPERTEIETQLHHVHLPKLTASGVVDYDARSQQLRYWPHERLEALLEDIQAYTGE